MARIAGIDLPREKRVEIGLTYIYGIGRTSANKILAQAGISPDVRVKDLSEEDEAKLREIIGHDYTVEGDLRRNVAMDIKRLTEIGCYRGIRHRKGLPVRGQRSKTNARTRKGPKRTVANEKRVEIGLTYIYGIGRTSANKILAQAGISPDVRVKDLSEEDEAKLREIIGHDYTVEGDLRRNVAMDIKRLTEIGCYRGIRHRKGLPVRGQRSKTNARTRKGPKRTVANKKK